MQIVVDVEHPNGFLSNDPQHIHISALQIPPTYDAAFDCVTAIHARPPVIPPYNPPSAKVAPPPVNGYDFIIHVGLAGRGPFRIERLAHKSGYRMKDSSNQYAPVIEFLPEMNAFEPSQAEILNQMRVSSANLAIMGPVGPVETAIDHPVRGFGKGYELCAEDLHTMIDVEHLVYAMKEQGVEVCIYPSLVLLRLIYEHDADLFVNGCWTLRERLHVLLLHGRISPRFVATGKGANQGSFHALLSFGSAVLQ